MKKDPKLRTKWKVNVTPFQKDQVPKHNNLGYELQRTMVPTMTSQKTRHDKGNYNVSHTD